MNDSVHIFENEEQVLTFIEFLNRQDPNLKFTLDKKEQTNTPFPNLYAVTTCHMKTRPYLVNYKQTDIRM